MQIVADTSALFAILMREPGYMDLRDAILEEIVVLPSPVIVEFSRVAMRRGIDDDVVYAFFQQLMRGRCRVEPFSAEMAMLAHEANRRFGAGNGQGGLLNLLDLMVYATAKQLEIPILCTGNDFASTDAVIYHASRPY